MDPLAALLDLIKTAGVPGAIALVIILRIESRLDKLTDAVLSLPQRMMQCQSATKSERQESIPITSPPSFSTSPGSRHPGTVGKAS
jgi:hypothetical protein